MNNIKEIEEIFDDLRSSERLPYISKFWRLNKMGDSSSHGKCYSSFYNGCIFPDLPVKPISTPFEFNEDIEK